MVGNEMDEIIDTANKAEEYRETLKVVAAMRIAQKNYFKSRTQKDLVDAKRIEASVDYRLSELGIRAY